MKRTAMSLDDLDEEVEKTDLFKDAAENDNSVSAHLASAASV